MPSQSCTVILYLHHMQSSNFFECITRDRLQIGRTSKVTVSWWSEKGKNNQFQRSQHLPFTYISAMDEAYWSNVDTVTFEMLVCSSVLQERERRGRKPPQGQFTRIIYQVISLQGDGGETTNIYAFQFNVRSISLGHNHLGKHWIFTKCDDETNIKCLCLFAHWWRQKGRERERNKIRSWLWVNGMKLMGTETANSWYG